MYCYLPGFCIFLSRLEGINFNDAEAGYIFEYFHTCLFVIITPQLRLKHRLTTLTINFYRAAVMNYQNVRIDHVCSNIKY